MSYYNIFTRFLQFRLEQISLFPDRRPVFPCHCQKNKPVHRSTGLPLRCYLLFQQVFLRYPPSPTHTFRQVIPFFGSLLCTVYLYFYKSSSEKPFHIILPYYPGIFSRSVTQHCKDQFAKRFHPCPATHAHMPNQDHHQYRYWFVCPVYTDMGWAHGNISIQSSFHAVQAGFRP